MHGTARRLIFAASTSLWLLLATRAAAGEIYHWIDDRGHHHYSDRPQGQSQAYQPSHPLQRMPKPRLPAMTGRSSDKPGKHSKAAAQARAEAKQQAKMARRCQGYAKKLRSINARLRRGHSNDQGNRWRRQRRDVQALRWKNCR